jgi:hypothetical protein
MEYGDVRGVKSGCFSANNVVPIYLLKVLIYDTRKGLHTIGLSLKFYQPLMTRQRS